MTEFIFRFPADMPELSYRPLDAEIGKLCSQPNCRSCVLEIGTTVKVRRLPLALEFRLYDTVIAYIYPGCVEFSKTDDPHQATTEWLTRIVQDNGIGYGVGRIRRHKADGPGPETSRGRAGLLVIEWTRSRPVVGRTYPVDRARQLKQRESRRRVEEFRAGRLTWDEAYASAGAR